MISKKPQQKEIGIQVGVGGTVSDESSGSESDQDIQRPENAMAMLNSTTCKTKDSATSPDPDEIAKALLMLNLDTDINLFQDSIDDFDDMMDDF